MFRAYTYKLIRSPYFYVGLIGIVILCCTDFIHNVRFGYDSVLYHVEIFLGLAQYRRALVLFAALPFVANFAEEWKSGVIKSCVTRIGIKKYAVTNVLFCWLTTIITAFLGLWLFMCLDSLFVPWSQISPNPPYCIFEEYINYGHGEIYLLFTTLIFAASCGMWAVMGMLMSVLFPNKYVAVCAPFAACYIVERLTMGLPNWFDLHWLALSYIPYDYFNNSFLGFLYCVGLFGIIAAVCGVLLCILIKRKVNNELS